MRVFNGFLFRERAREIYAERRDAARRPGIAAVVVFFFSSFFFFLFFLLLLLLLLLLPAGNARSRFRPNEDILQITSLVTNLTSDLHARVQPRYT